MESAYDQTTGTLRKIYDIMASSEALNLLCVVNGFILGFGYAYVELSKAKDSGAPRIESAPLRIIIAIICGLVVAALILVIAHYIFINIPNDYKPIITFGLSALFIGSVMNLQIKCGSFAK